MATVGTQLRTARERLNLTVRDVANATNIKSDHLRAIEDGQWAVFGATVYVKGFVRTYAHHLKLPAAELLRELDGELEGVLAKEGGAPSAGRRRGPVDYLMLQLSQIRWTVVFPLLLGIAVVAAALYGFRAWKALERRDPLQGLGNGLYPGRPLAVPVTLPLPAATSGAPPASLPAPVPAPAPRR
ncbi:MAG: helix-turn-helix domain-containing protein [Verrucomicrobiota bacterium]